MASDPLLGTSQPSTVGNELISKEEEEPPLLDERKKKQLMAKKSVDFFNTIELFVNQDFEKQREIQNALHTLSSLKGIQEDILRSIQNNDFTMYESSPDEFSVMLELAHIRNKLMVEYLREAFALFTSEQIGIQKWEKMALPYLFQIALVCDEMYIKWRTSLFPKDIYTWSEEDKLAFKQNVLKDLNDPYAIIDKTPQGFYFQVPYRDAFRKETAKIVKYLIDLIEIMDSYTGDDVTTFKSYLMALKDAYEVGECIKIGQLWLSEIKWREVDRKWLKMKGKLQIWHSMEYGYNKMLDISGIRIIPEFRITYLNELPIIDKINSYLRLLQGAHVNYYFKKYFHDEKILKMVNHMKDCHIGVYDTLFGGGSSLDFSPHGQVGPNDSVENRQGFKSSLDILHQEETYDKEKFIMKTIFHLDENEEDHLWILSPVERIAIYISSHELSHPLFGDWGEFEEFKASWTGIVPLKEEEEMGIFRTGILRDTLFSHILCCLRYLTTEDRTDPYFIEAVINMHFCMQSGVLTRHHDGKWDINLDHLLYADHSYFHEMNLYYNHLLEIAVQGKKEVLQEEGKKVVEYNDLMEQLIRDVQQANILYYASKRKT
jgi:hypothetical protein